jgi:hypothetical protein
MLQDQEEAEMRVKMFRQVRSWAAGVLLLAGLMYSVLALTLTAKPAHAKTVCTPAQCTEGGQDAVEFCASVNSTVVRYICPFDPNQSGWFVECENGRITGDLCSN